MTKNGSKQLKNVQVFSFKIYWYTQEIDLFSYLFLY